MPWVPIFTGHIDARAELHLTPNEAGMRRKWRESLIGHEVELVIRKRRTKRSGKQNRWIHAAASALADHCGLSLAEMKCELMGACWGWHTLPSGHEVPVKLHTSDMTVDEAAHFTDWLIAWALEHFPEVEIPLPGQAEAA